MGLGVQGTGARDITPAGFVKNRKDRLVMLNSAAKSVIGEVCSQHKEYVFIYQGHKAGKINNGAWKRAREKAGHTLAVG
jgi:hypothetical protein